MIVEKRWYLGAVFSHLMYRCDFLQARARHRMQTNFEAVGLFNVWQIVADISVILSGAGEVMDVLHRISLLP